MKLVYHQLNQPIVLSENKVNVVVIENPLFYRNFILDLQDCLLGKNEKFVLSDNDRELNLGKSLYVIFSVFNIEINSHKIISQLYESLDNIAHTDEFIYDTNSFEADLATYAVKLLQKSDLPLTFNENIDLVSIFKALNIRFDEEGNSIVDKLAAFIELAKAFLKIKILCFINAKSFLTAEELKLLYKAAEYHKMQLLFIENKEYDRFSCEKYIIIDLDLCEI